MKIFNPAQLTYIAPLFSAIRGLSIILILVLIASGCDEFVDVGLPGNQLTSETVFEDPATATAAMTNIYSKLRDSGLLTGTSLGLSSQLGHYADELVYYGAAGSSSEQFFNNAVISSNPLVSQYWNESYNQIYAANSVIEGVANSTALSGAVKQQLLGEALFTRALIHFYLVNLFGGIPYVKTTDYEINSHPTRKAIAEVYVLLVEDLEEAVSLLSPSYVTVGRVRPNQAAAQALLARVYLYSSQWAAAADMASAVINNSGLYQLDMDLDTGFLHGSPSAIWQFMPKPGRNTEEGMTFIFTSGPPPFTALSEDLVAAFEAGDLRKDHWVKEISNGSSTWYHANKYRLDGNAAGGQESSQVLRLAEVYLIRSEARARQGEISAAADDLNTIRNRAGLDDTDAGSQSEILFAIEQERRVELFTEFGHRFFDLKRYNRLDAVLGYVKPGWDSHEAYLPIPQVELSANPHLQPQNPGY